MPPGRCASMWRLLQARLPARARAAALRLLAGAAGGAARRAAGPVAEAAGRGRARGRPARCWCRRGRPRRCRPRPRWFLQRGRASRVQRRFRDRVTIALESHVARLQASVATIAHQERPEYLDRLSVLRDQVFVLDHMYMSRVLHLRLDPAPGRGRRPADVDPSRAAGLLAAVRRCPTVLTSTWRPGVERTAEERGAPDEPAGPAPVRDRHHGAARQGGAGHRHRPAPGAPSGARPGSAGTGRVAAARWGSAAWHIVGLGGLRRRATSARSCFVASGLDGGRGGRAAGARRRRAALGLHRRHRRRDRLPARHLAGRRRGGWPGSRTTPRRSTATADQPAPAAAAPTASASSTCRSPTPAPSGSCSTTSTSRCPRRGRRDRRRERRRQDDARQAARASCTSRRRAGSWSTASPLARMPRGRVALAAGRRVPGLLPLRAAGRSSPSASATCRASTTSRPSPPPSAGPAPTTSSRACRTASTPSSGRPGPSGVEVSFGQWQKLALARGFMRDEPLLLVLDEPTAALDAETEHALFERYAAARPRQRRRRPAASRSSSRTASAPCAWPT